MSKRLIFLFLMALVTSVAVKPVFAQTTEPYQWNSVAIGGGGFVSGIITSKTQAGLMYARTDVGGAYRWDATKNIWIPLTDWASDQQQGVFGVESIALDPNNSNIVYMSTGISYFNNGKSYILRSTDYGANFTITDVTNQFKIHGNGYGRQNGEKLQVDPNNSTILYCGTRWNGLFKSTNSGANWNRLAGLNVTTTPNENGVSFVLLDKSANSSGATQRIFAGISRAGGDQNFYKSEDGGLNFTAVINPNLTYGLMPQRGVFSGDGNIYITYGNGAGPGGTTAEPMSMGQIWKYNIATTAWTNVTPTGLTSAFGGISVDPANPKRMVASTINKYAAQGNSYGDRFYLTTDGGVSWIDVVARGFSLDANGITWGQDASIHWSGCIEFDPFNTKKVFVISGNGLFVNENIDATSGTWKFFVSGLEETVPRNFISIPGGPAISVIGDYDGFRHTNVNKYASIHTPRIGSTSGLDYAVASKGKVVRVGSDKMYYSVDTGKTWTKTLDIKGTDGQVAYSADGTTLLHSPDNVTLTYRSVNNGTNWVACQNLGVSSGRPVADGFNSNKFYMYDPSSGAFYISKDAGVSFSSAANPGAYGSKIIRTVPGREGHIWIPLYGGGLKRSQNSGTSFEKINNVSYCGAVGIGKAAPNTTYETIYIWGSINNSTLGIYRSIDQGANWTRVNDDQHQYGGPGNGQFIVGDMNTYGTVYMSTAGRGVIYGEAFQKRFVTLKNSNFSINENSVIGTLVANPVVADVNETNLHGWSILDGDPSKAFNIDPASGQITVDANAVLDFEAQKIYNLAIGMLDKTNTEVRTQITVTLNDVNEAPTDIVLSKTAISQGNTIGAVVATLNSTDSDANSTFTYSLASGVGSDDNTAFTVTGAELRASQVFDFNAKSTYKVRLRTTDNGGLTYEQAFVINIIKISTLPVTNFKVKTYNELCASNNDGRITVDAVQNLNYKATLVGANFSKDISFTTTGEFASLQAGVYTLCITSVDVPDYQQCFDLTILEPKPLAVYSSVNPKTNTLFLSLSGATSYDIELNGKTFKVDSNAITLDLVKGVNNLKVNTDKYCQGLFEKRFFIEAGSTVYPNPFGQILYLNLGNDTSDKVNVDIYSVNGERVYSKQFSNQVDIALELDLSALKNGTYVLKSTTFLNTNTFKIIKQ